jgi:peptide/nickel transport system substrate-binding protein
LAKDTLTIGISQFPSTFHPAIDTMLAKSYVLSFVRRPLTAYDAHWKLVCLMCERLPTLENGLAKLETTATGKKGIAITIAIKAGAKWADGVPVGSDDLVFGWQVGKHPSSGVSEADLYRRVTAIDVLDERTVTLHVDRVSFDYNALGDFKLLPAHIERSRFEADPARYHDRTAYDRDTTMPGLWNGPYRIARVDPGNFVQMDRNPYWNGTPPAFDHLIVRVIENTASLEASVLSGGVDMVAGELGLALEQAMSFGQRHHDRFVVTTTPSLVYEHLDLNLDNPLFADRRVRLALTLALDRDSICQNLFASQQNPATSFVPPLDPAFSTTRTDLGYNPTLAQQLLDQAGFLLKDGIRTGPDGQPLAFELITTAGNRSRELVAEILQAQWRRLGIVVRLKMEPPRIFFGQTVTKRHFAGMAMFAWYSAPESIPRAILRSTEIPSAQNGWAGENYTGYKSPAMDALIDTIEQEPDFNRRRPLWQQMQELYNQDLPAIPLFFKSDAHIWPKQLQGITPTGHADPSPLWVENWSWKAL